MAVGVTVSGKGVGVAVRVTVIAIIVGGRLFRVAVITSVAVAFTLAVMTAVLLTVAVTSFVPVFVWVTTALLLKAVGVVVTIGVVAPATVTAVLWGLTRRTRARQRWGRALGQSNRAAIKLRISRPISQLMRPGVRRCARLV